MTMGHKTWPGRGEITLRAKGWKANVTYTSTDPGIVNLAMNCGGRREAGFLGMAEHSGKHQSHEVMGLKAEK